VDRLPEQRVDTLRGDPRGPGWSALIERQQGRGQWRGFAGVRSDRGVICAQLGQLGVTFRQRPQDGKEEDCLAEDPRVRQTQRISDPAVMMLVCQDRVELGLGQELDRSPGDVDPGAQIAGAEGLWQWIRDDINAGIFIQGLDDSDLIHQ